jgi:hypothetical protein
METLDPHDQHVAQVAADLAVRKISPLIHRVIRALAIGGVLLVGGVTGGWLVVQDQARAIQDSRFKASRDSCRAQNGRNHETLLALGEVTPGVNTSRMSTRERDRQIAATTFLINKIVPYRPNCDAVARKAVATP